MNEYINMETPLQAKQTATLSAKQGSNRIPFFSPCIQPKLTINQPNDVYEQEADTVADKVMRTKDVSVNKHSFFKPAISTAQRKCQPCEEKEKKLHRKESKEASAVSPQTETYINTLSGGSPWHTNERSFFESRMGYDFSNVRLHTDQMAAKSAQSVSALAYTSGNNIVFNEGQYQSGTESGKRLLAHELTHVVQQQNLKNNIQRDAIPADLKLPCKWGDYFFEDNKISGIRILIAMAEADKGNLPDLKKVAAQITSDNAAIGDAKWQVKTCIISPATTTRFATYMGEPVLMIDPSDADIQTIRHEMGHALFNFTRHNKTAKLNKTVAAGDWMTNLADVFLGLRNITLTKGKSDSITANLIVDPSEWKPGSKAEHPSDADEFFASAKEAYQTDKKALMATFAKYGKQDKAVIALGDRLLNLLQFVFEKQKSGKQKNASDAKDITEQLDSLREPSKVEDTLGIHQLADMLLDPDKRPRCK